MRSQKLYFKFFFKLICISVFFTFLVATLNRTYPSENKNEISRESKYRLWKTTNPKFPDRATKMTKGKMTTTTDTCHCCSSKGQTTPAAQKVSSDENKRINTSEAFQAIVPKHSWVYSAFFDTSPNGKTYIRAFGITGNNITGAIFCHVLAQGSHDWISLKGSLSLLPDGHPEYTVHSASLILCPLPPDLKPEFVAFTLRKKGTATNRVPVNYPGEKMIREFTVCNGILHGNFDKADQLIQSWEMAKILGAEHFFIYSLSVSNKVTRVLQHYKQIGELTVLPWGPDNTVDLAWYHAQNVAINDCVYRNRNLSRYVIVQDTDEVAVPLRHLDWDEMLAEFDITPPLNGNKETKQRASFSVESNVHCKRAPESNLTASFDDYSVGKIVRSFIRNYNVGIFDVLVRSQHFEYPDRCKTFVRPEGVDTMGIHIVHKYRDGFTGVPIPSDVAVLNHYYFNRDCWGELRVFQPQILRYANQFYSRAKKIYKLHYKDTHRR